MPQMLLIVEPLGQRAERGRAAGEAVYQRMLDFAAELQASGLLLGVNSLGTPARRLTKRDGGAQVWDGPFAEAKEMVGGYRHGLGRALPGRGVGHGGDPWRGPLLHVSPSPSRAALNAGAPGRSCRPRSRQSGCPSAGTASPQDLPCPASAPEGTAMLAALSRPAASGGPARERPGARPA